MVWRLSVATSLPEPMLTCCQLNPWEQTTMKFESTYKHFHSWQCIWKGRLRNGGHFVQRRWVNGAVWHHRARLTIVQIKACRLGDAKSSRVRIFSCQQVTYGKPSVIFLKRIQPSYWWKYIVLIIYTQLDEFQIYTGITLCSDETLHCCLIGFHVCCN